MKRIFDVIAAAVGLVLLSPLFVMVALAIKLTSPGPILFKQERIGREFQPFLIYKFRTMVSSSEPGQRQITVHGDPRVTWLGRWLRKSKIDELPQLFNVFTGDMSLVGPRPEVSRYVELFRKDYEEVLQVRPGITDLASLKYRDESEVLARAADPEEEYTRHILPEKLRLAKEYVRRSSVIFDTQLLCKTVLKVVAGV